MDRFNSLLIQDTDAFQAGNHAERAIEHSATGYRVGVGTDRHGRTAIRPPASDHITRPVHPGFQAVGPETVHEPSSDRKSTRLNSSHVKISYAVFCLKKKTPQPE